MLSKINVGTKNCAEMEQNPSYSAVNRCSHLYAILSLVIFFRTYALYLDTEYAEFVKVCTAVYDIHMPLLPACLYTHCNFNHNTKCTNYLMDFSIAENAQNYQTLSSLMCRLQRILPPKKCYFSFVKKCKFRLKFCHKSRISPVFRHPKMRPF